MSDNFDIQSHKGPYHVFFNNDILINSNSIFDGEVHVLVDSNVARLYKKQLGDVLENPRTLVIDATEENKSIERIIDVIHKLVDHKIRRNHKLVAIGGGIIQDISCFIASTLLRGLEWILIPTTLLAQTDSCIGSKSSVNLGSVKNILGTFNPPREVHISSTFIDTLKLKDVHSGIGEILKVHAIDSSRAFDQLVVDFDQLIINRRTLLKYVRQALLIKQRYIEEDEFDMGIRNVFNYGHSFGHAIESATKFAIPHGIAVTMGMEIANKISNLRGTISDVHYKRMQPVLFKNYSTFNQHSLPFENILSALTKDKKNTTTDLVLILPIGEDAKVSRIEIENDADFQAQLKVAIEGVQG